MNFFSKLSLKAKLLLIVGLSCVICGSISVSVAVYFTNKEFVHGLVEKARIVHGRLNVAAQYVAQQDGLSTIIKDYTSKYTSSDQLTDKDKEIILKQVPIYAAMKIGAEDSEKEMYNFRVFSDEPRNIKNQATSEEMEIFKKFLNDPNLKEFVGKDNKSVTVYRPVRILEKSGCLTCHGQPSQSPWGNGKDILGYKMESWSDGKLHGVFAISSDIAAVSKASTNGNDSTFYLGLFITLGGLFALAIAYFVISKPVTAMSVVADTISQAGSQLSEVSDKIQTSSHDLSESSHLQSSSLQQTAATLEQLTAMVSKNTEYAKRTAAATKTSHEKAEFGKESVEKMLHAIDDINQSNEMIMGQVNTSNKQMEEIIQVIQEISNKTKVINDIVFQTKLLSFNASVEAARAGEHGKGFAVVAEEVGNLAQMSGNAAKEITDMLSSSVAKVEVIINETKTGVSSLIEQGKDKVQVGVDVANQCNAVLNEIVTHVAEVSSMANEISAASQEQTQGIIEINKAIANLESVTQKNSQTSHEASASATDLSNQAQSLNLAVNNLVTTIHGHVQTQTHQLHVNQVVTLNKNTNEKLKRAI